MFQVKRLVGSAIVALCLIGCDNADADAIKCDSNEAILAISKPTIERLYVMEPDKETLDTLKNKGEAKFMWDGKLVQLFLKNNKYVYDAYDDALGNQKMIFIEISDFKNLQSTKDSATCSVKIKIEISDLMSKESEPEGDKFILKKTKGGLIAEEL